MVPLLFLNLAFEWLLFLYLYLKFILNDPIALKCVLFPITVCLPQAKIIPRFSILSHTHTHTYCTYRIHTVWFYFLITFPYLCQIGFNIIFSILLFYKPHLFICLLCFRLTHACFFYLTFHIWKFSQPDSLYVSFTE